MSVQDDERERELVRVFNLAWDPAHQRAGVDAMLVGESLMRQADIGLAVKQLLGTAP